jgi:hypothetical protein
MKHQAKQDFTYKKGKYMQLQSMIYMYMWEKDLAKFKSEIWPLRKEISYFCTLQFLLKIIMHIKRFQLISVIKKIITTLVINKQYSQN